MARLLKRMANTKVRQRLKELGISQSELAAKLGISITLVNHYCVHGVKTVRVAEKLAHPLACRAADLLDFTKKDEAPDLCQALLDLSREYAGKIGTRKGILISTQTAKNREHMRQQLLDLCEAYHISKDAISALCGAAYESALFTPPLF